VKYLISICSFILLFIGVIFFVPSAFAATPNILAISVDTNTPVIGDQFSVTASMSGAVANGVYFFKCRIGANSSSLADGQTYNNQTSQWLDDTGSNGAWVDMPQITVDGGGVWQGTLQCRVKDSVNDEAKVLYIRACLNANSVCGTSFQSTQSLTLNPIMPTSTPSPTPTPTNTPTPQPTCTPTSTPIPTRTPTPTKTPTPTPTSTPTPTKVLASDSAVLGSTTSTQSASVSADPPPKSTSKQMAIAILFIGLGCGMLTVAFILKR
jgi:hypothetical protein